MRYIVLVSSLLATSIVIAGTTTEHEEPYREVGRFPQTASDDRHERQIKNDEDTRLQVRNAAAEPGSSPPSDPGRHKNQSNQQQAARRSPSQESSSQKRQRFDGAGTATNTEAESSHRPGRLTTSEARSSPALPGTISPRKSADSPNTTMSLFGVNNPPFARNPGSSENRRQTPRAQDERARRRINAVRRPPVQRNSQPPVAEGPAPKPRSLSQGPTTSASVVDMPPIPNRLQIGRSKLGPADLAAAPLRNARAASASRSTTTQPDLPLLPLKLDWFVSEESLAALRVINESDKQKQQGGTSSDAATHTSGIDMNPRAWPGYDHWRSATVSPFPSLSNPVAPEAPINMDPISWPGYGRWLPVSDLPSRSATKTASKQASRKLGQQKPAGASMIPPAIIPQPNQLQQSDLSKVNPSIIRPPPAAKPPNTTAQIRHQPGSKAPARPQPGNIPKRPDSPIDLTILTSSEESSGSETSQQHVTSRPASPSVSSRNSDSRQTSQSTSPSLAPFSRIPSIGSSIFDLLESSSSGDLQTSAQPKFSPTQSQRQNQPQTSGFEALRAPGWQGDIVWPSKQPSTEPLRQALRQPSSQASNQPLGHSVSLPSSLPLRQLSMPPLPIPRRQSPGRLMIPPRDPRIAPFRLVMAPVEQPVLQVAQLASTPGRLSPVGSQVYSPGGPALPSTQQGWVVRTGARNRPPPSHARSPPDSPTHSISERECDQMLSDLPFPEFLQEWINDVDLPSSPSFLQKRHLIIRDSIISSDEGFDADHPQLAARTSPESKKSIKIVGTTKPTSGQTKQAVPSVPKVEMPEIPALNDRFKWTAKRQRSNVKDLGSLARKRPKSTWSGSADDMLDKHVSRVKQANAKSSMKDISKNQVKGASKLTPAAPSRRLSENSPDTISKGRSDQLTKSSKSPPPARSQSPGNELPSPPSSLARLSSPDPDFEGQTSRLSKNTGSRNSGHTRMLRSSTAAKQQQAVTLALAQADLRRSQTPPLQAQRKAAAQSLSRMAAEPRPPSVNPLDTPQKMNPLIRPPASERGKPIELKQSWGSHITRSQSKPHKGPVYSGPPHLFPGFADAKRPETAANPDKKGTITMTPLKGHGTKFPQEPLPQPDLSQSRRRDGQQVVELSKQVSQTPASMGPTTPARTLHESPAARMSHSPPRNPFTARPFRVSKTAQSMLSPLPPRLPLSSISLAELAGPRESRTILQPHIGPMYAHIERQRLRDLIAGVPQGPFVQQPGTSQSPSTQRRMNSGGLPQTMQFARLMAERHNIPSSFDQHFQQHGQQWDSRAQAIRPGLQRPDGAQQRAPAIDASRQHLVVPSPPALQPLPEPRPLQPGNNPAKDMFNFWHSNNDS